LSRLIEARRLGLLVVALLTSLCVGAAAAPSFPALTGRVVDDAHLLKPAVQAQLTQALADLEANTSRQLVIVTLPSLQGYEIADYGYQLGRAWGIGQKSQNNGVLFIIAPKEHKARIEVGYGLEGILTDALSSLILQERVLPKFRAGDMEGGIIDGTTGLIHQLSLDPSEAEKIAAQAARRAQPTRSGPVPVTFFLILAIWIFVAFLGRRRGGLIGTALPWIILNSGRRGFGGSAGRGGFSGGGFSGGGGSFGGGGASGSW
jgi:uncharacterized protein